MTNKEAIKYIQANYPNCNAYSGLREALDLAVTALRAQAEKEQPMNITTAIAITKDVMSDYASPITKEALGMAVDALKSKAGKERRYVVKEGTGGTWLVRNSISNVYVAAYIHTEAAAQAIADIYEQYAETKE